MDLKSIETMRSSAGAVESMAALLRGLIDYAGLFPPASLAMERAVANYATYSQSEWSWILGRFILPVARLGEFEEALSQLPAAGKRTESSWALSALLEADVIADLERIREFNDRLATSHSAAKAAIESVEVKIVSVADIKQLCEIIPTKLETHFEVSLSGNERCCVAAIANGGRRAKIRTGGETADKFPAPENVVEFLRLCGEFNVPFKATAGLHHPLRSPHRFTYQPESPSGIMHGFLNVFLAAAFLQAGLEPAFALQLLEEQSAQAFHFDSDEVIWREHRLSVRDISAARHEFAISFGSCSFTEPVEELRTLHVL